LKSSASSAKALTSSAPKALSSSITKPLSTSSTSSTNSQSGGAIRKVASGNNLAAKDVPSGIEKPVVAASPPAVKAIPAPIDDKWKKYFFALLVAFVFSHILRSLV
jgi:hypothetical protein